MNIWVFYIYEAVPGVDPGEHHYRHGELCRTLADLGHNVTWWQSTFFHYRKKQRFATSQRCRVRDGYAVDFVYGPGYRRNVSLARVRHNRQVAATMARRLELAEDVPDLLHVCIPCVEVAEIVAKYSGQHGVPMTVDAHDMWPDIYLQAFPPAFRRLGRWLLWREFARARRSYRQAAAFTAVSDTYLQWILGYADRDRTVLDRVFPLGYYRSQKTTPAERAAHYVELRRRWNMPDDRFVVVFVGTFGAFYDVEALIHAARLAHQRGNRALHFLLIGDGDKMERARHLAAGLQNVTLPGWIDQQDVWATIQQAQIGVAAYTERATQSLPYKPFEYMAAGLPQLNSLGGEMRGILLQLDCGRPYRAGDAGDLLRQIEQIYADPVARTRMAANALRAFEERFDMRAVSRQMAEHLVEVASRFARSARPLGRSETSVTGT